MLRVRGDTGAMRSLAVVLTVSLLAACGGDDEATDESTTVAASSDAGVARQRLGEIDRAVTDWAVAGDIESAHAAAETAANLVVGPNGPGYGDRDGDGEIAGANDAGLLSGVDGTPSGLAVPLADNACVARDVLAGTTTDPVAAWDQMAAVIAAWTPDENTMPQLASHPMRIVGWATLTLAADSLDEAHEYAGHAALHVSVSQDALDC